MKRIIFTMLICLMSVSCYSQDANSKIENTDTKNINKATVNQEKAAQVTLNGKTITYKEIIQIADGAKVELDSKAVDTVKKAHDTLIKAATTGHKIYGLTVGVGLNKDRAMVNAQGELTDEVINASREFNKGLIHAHCGGYGDFLDVRTTRTIMAVRLNNMLTGGSGVQYEVVEMLQAMLNNNIIPLIPSQGSIGMADITVLGHLGLPMIGEGDVLYKGQIVPASQALQSAGLKPVVLFGKDALSIVSSNAYGAALTVLALNDAEQLIKMSKIVYALSLESLNGNVAPFSENANNLRPFPYFVKVSKDVRALLQGSYLYQPNEERALQDPLSFRDSVHFIGAMEQAFDELNRDLTIQLNTSDDNPGVLVNGAKGATEQEKIMLVQGGGAVVPNSNFDPVIWVLALEKFSISLGAMSNVATQRTIKLDDDYFTKLTRFLGTDKTVHAFGAMQKPFTALNGENIFLSNQMMLLTVPVAGNIEDIATNAPGVAQKVQKQIDNLFYIYGMELVHSAQAVDLRKTSKTGFKMAPATEKLYNEFRKIVKFLDVDRPLTDDFNNAAAFLKTYK